MIDDKEEYDSILKSGMFWEFHPELLGNWEKDKNYFKMEKAKMINTDNFEGNINTSRLNSLLDSFVIREDITKEDEEEMWKQVEKDYLESSQQ